MSKLFQNIYPFRNLRLYPIFANRLITTSSINKLKINTTKYSNNDTQSPFSIQHQSPIIKTNEISLNVYEKASNETLESLSEKFDQIGEDLSEELSKNYDVSFNNGVLTVKFGPSIGTYVLNKQTPNLQIWLSSPLSGPKRYDLINNQWIYKRTNESLNQLLSNEISQHLNTKIDFNDDSK